MMHNKQLLNRGAWFLTGMGIGAFSMYLLDPGRGARRRALIQDKAVRAGNYIADRADKRARDAANRLKGAVAEAQARFESEDVPDDVLVERVRAQLGHVVSHPGSLEVRMDNGRLIISGPVLLGEAEKIRERLEKTRGVRDYDLQVTEHAEAANNPGLQGESRWQRQHKTG